MMYPTIKTVEELIEALGNLNPATPLIGERADTAGLVVVPQEPSGAVLICSPDKNREPSVSP
jgi:hypothetical protein